MATVEIKEEKIQLEERYNKERDNHADVLTLSAIWKRIKDLEAELKNRGV